MKTTYFKFVAQKSVHGTMVLVAVVPESMFGTDVPLIIEGQAFLMPATIYTGTYPQIKINTDTITDRSDLRGVGIGGIVTAVDWYVKDDVKKDVLGISLTD